MKAFFLNQVCQRGEAKPLADPIINIIIGTDLQLFGSSDKGQKSVVGLCSIPGHGMQPHISFPNLNPGLEFGDIDRFGQKIIRPTPYGINRNRYIASTRNDHNCTIGFGLIQPLGAIMPLAEAQSQWVAKLPAEGMRLLF